MRKNYLVIIGIALVLVLVAGAAAWTITGADDTGNSQNGGGIVNGNDQDDDGENEDEGKPSEKDADGDGIDDLTASGRPAVSDNDNVKVTSPDPDQYVSSHWLIITGEARVFENQFNWRVKDEGGEVIGEGTAYANAPDIGQYGEYVIYATYTAVAGQKGTVEVFDYSERDGSVEELVSVPVYFGTDREVSIYLANQDMASEGGECEEMFAVDRFIFDSTLPSIELRQALWLLLVGTTAEEKADGYGSVIPDGVTLNSLNLDVENSEVTIDFSSEIEAGGSCRVTAIREQIEQTVYDVLGDNYTEEFNVVITVDGGSPEEALQP